MDVGQRPARTGRPPCPPCLFTALPALFKSMGSPAVPASLLPPLYYRLFTTASCLYYSLPPLAFTLPSLLPQLACRACLFTTASCLYYSLFTTASCLPCLPLYDRLFESMCSPTCSLRSVVAEGLVLRSLVAEGLMLGYSLFEITCFMRRSSRLLLPV